ncbi:MAG TPA: hypothetical protein VLB01_03580 [Thermodesulfobacteriota bacterium]|nr:hypothetical protein [Thermodesulfobacteriota bacterium]
MSVKEKDLKKKQKITLSIPEKYVGLVLEAAKLGEKEGKSLSIVVWEALEDYLNRYRSKTIDEMVDSILEDARILADERKSNWDRKTNLKLSKQVMEMIRQEALNKGVALESEEEALVDD